jgi:hypothetical protein
MEFSRIFLSLILIVGTSMEAARVTHRHKPAKVIHTAIAKRKVAHKIALNKAHQPHHKPQRASTQHKKIQKQAVKPASKPVIPHVIHPARHAAKMHVALNALPDQFALPRSLQRLNRARICHLRVTQQTGNQCGSRSVANALAVQDVIGAGQALTALNIRAQAQHHNNILINRILSDREVSNLATRNHLMNGYIMSPIPGNLQHFAGYSIANNTQVLNSLIRNIRTQHMIIAPIIFNTGGHWVLITIIKMSGQTPQIIYMDSCNSPLQDNSVATLAINYLYQQAIA